MSIAENLRSLETQLAPTSARLVAVSKTKPVEVLLEAYRAGCRRFGENKVQEMVAKHEAMPPDVEWHLIGHLQTNKVKYIAPFVHLIHSVDSLKLLQEIDKQAARVGRVQDCLLQLHLAREETKFGLSFEEAESLLRGSELDGLPQVRITGLMGMASNTDDEAQVRAEFRGLNLFFERMKTEIPLRPNVALRDLSMGMSGDFPLALAEGSTLVRVGSLIFGERIPLTA
ncbi:MAG: YggS family pyridoxal phosphate-dependent enzyme [Sphingobacteriaceae bacterium]|nr:YggS family pyridoxal phosphate-dependent enzyme [Cytophagaceae bacterium]